MVISKIIFNEFSIVFCARFHVNSKRNEKFSDCISLGDAKQYRGKQWPTWANDKIYFRGTIVSSIPKVLFV